MSNFLYDINREFKKDFFLLLPPEDQESLKNLIIGLDMTDMTEEDIFDEILASLGMSLEEAIKSILHYNLDIYMDVVIDETGNTLAKNLAIGRLMNGTFSGIHLKLESGLNYHLLYIGDNELLNELEQDDYALEERLKQFVGEEQYNQIFILLNNIMLYDEDFGSYIGVKKAYDILYGNANIYIEDNNKKVYINSTLNSDDFEIVRE